MLVYQRVAMMRLAVVSTTCRNKLLAMSGYVPISKALEKYGATTEVQGNGIGVKTPVMTQSSLLLMNPSILPWHKGQTVCSLRMLEVHLQYLILL